MNSYRIVLCKLKFLALVDNVEPKVFRVLEKVSSTIDKNEERCEENDKKEQHEMEWKQVALVLGTALYLLSWIWNSFIIPNTSQPSDWWLSSNHCVIKCLCWQIVYCCLFSSWQWPSPPLWFWPLHHISSWTSRPPLGLNLVEETKETKTNITQW